MSLATERKALSNCFKKAGKRAHGGQGLRRCGPSAAGARRRRWR